VEEAAAEQRRKRRGSRFDAPSGGGFGGPPPDALTPATNAQIHAGVACQPTTLWQVAAAAPSSRNYKIIKMTAVQIRALLGQKGECINRLRRQSGCDIQVHHRYPDPEGNCSVVGSVLVGERMIAEVLAERGCPLIPVDGFAPEDMEEVPIQQTLVGLFIGSGGSKIKEMQELCGGGVHISIQPHLDPAGNQIIRIVGPNRLKARAIIELKVEAIKCGHSADKPTRQSI